jgi:hypothetical protein
MFKNTERLTEYTVTEVYDRHHPGLPMYQQVLDNRYRVAVSSDTSQQGSL